MAVAHPFRIPVRDLIGAPGVMRELELEVSAPEHYGEAVARVEKDATLEITARLESVHEGILATGEVNCVAQAECVRCLEPIRLPISADFQELFAYSDQDGYDSQVVDETIDLESVVRDQVVLQLPFQPMCSADCPGLDPETGRKRSPGEAGEQEDRIDPRWSALQELLTDDTEK